METDPADYLYSAGLIGLVVFATGFFVVAAQGCATALLGGYAVIGLFFLFALTYGGITAVLLAVLSAWMPLREGDYAMDHPQFTLWKVQHVVGELGKVALSLFFPVFARSTFYSLFGAKVGKHVAVAGKIIDPRLTALGDNCILGEGCIVTSHVMVRDRFILREVRVGKGATVGVGCILLPGVEIGPGAVILPGSVLKTGTAVPAGETWSGVPAVCIRAAAD